MNTFNHTPGPWKKRLDGDHKWDGAICNGSRCICTVNFSYYHSQGFYSDAEKDERMANAEFIVNACNSHDDLLAACKEARATFVGFVQGSIGGQAISKINKAIKKAGGSR